MRAGPRASDRGSAVLQGPESGGFPPAAQFAVPCKIRQQCTICDAFKLMLAPPSKNIWTGISLIGQEGSTSR